MNGKISNFEQVASIRRYTVTDGRAQGLKVLDCDNGKIRFLLNESKNLDVMQLYHEGQNVSFLSKNAFTAREIGFLKRFEGGMLYTCGLDSVGGREGFELHGGLHNTPAEIVRAECTQEGITIESVTRVTSLFGENLVLKRKIFSAIGSESFTLEDTLENAGFKEENYCLLYHVNVGYPMLDEGGRVELNAKSVTPRNDWSAKHAATWNTMESPVDDFEETCYFVEMNEGKARYENPALRKAFELEYDKEALPCFIEWKSMVSGDYALGLEPATTFLDDKFAYSRIGKGETRKFRLTFRVEKL